MPIKLLFALFLFLVVRAIIRTALPLLQKPAPERSTVGKPQSEKNRYQKKWDIVDGEFEELKKPEHVRESEKMTP